jgi:hypothetical protein
MIAEAECSISVPSAAGETARCDSRVLADKEVVINAPTLIRREFCRTSSAHGRGEARRATRKLALEPAKKRAPVYTNILGCVNLDAGRTVPRATKVDTLPNFFLIALHREGV